MGAFGRVQPFSRRAIGILFLPMKDALVLGLNERLDHTGRKSVVNFTCHGPHF